jgi:hypothetical protein
MIFAATTVPALGQNAFDGVYTVTRTGIGCTPAGLISVRIDKGRFVGSYEGGTGTHRLTGTIQRSGAFSFTGQSPVDTVVFQGRIDGTRGSGNWEVRGKNCRGTLQIYR